MQLGFGRFEEKRDKIRTLRDEETLERRSIRIRPSLILSTHFANPLTENTVDCFHGREAGTFEVKASGDGVKAYGLLFVFNDDTLNGIDSIHHRQVCQILKRLLHIRREFGRVVLGGGFLLADYDQRRLMVFGQSGDYGRVPDFMQHGLFSSSGMKIHVAGYGNEMAHPGEKNLVSATDWYLSRGIEVEGEAGGVPSK